MIEREKILEFALKNMKELISKSKKEIEDIVLDRKAVDYKKSMNKEEIVEICDELCRDCFEKQKNGEIGKMKYLHFFILQSALITGNYEIQIQLFPKEQYLCKTGLFKLWKPKFIMDYFRKDMEEFDKRAKKEVIYYCYEDEMQIRKIYYPKYLRFVRNYLMEMIDIIEESEKFKMIEKEEVFYVIYGGYMEEGECLRKYSQIKEGDNNGREGIYG